MDFNLTEDQLRLKNAVKEFCKREFDPDLALELDRKEEFPINLYKKSAKQVFPSLFIPKRYGGGGQGYLASCLAMEEMCRADSSLGLASMIGTFGTDLILLNGTASVGVRADCETIRLTLGAGLRDWALAALVSLLFRPALATSVCRPHTTVRKPIPRANRRL